MAWKRGGWGVSVGAGVAVSVGVRVGVGEAVLVGADVRVRVGVGLGVLSVGRAVAIWAATTVCSALTTSRPPQTLKTTTMRTTRAKKGDGRHGAAPCGTLGTGWRRGMVWMRSSRGTAVRILDGEDGGLGTGDSSASFVVTTSATSSIAGATSAASSFGVMALAVSSTGLSWLISRSRSVRRASLAARAAACTNKSAEMGAPHIRQRLSPLVTTESQVGQRTVTGSRKRPLKLGSSGVSKSLIPAGHYTKSPH